MEIPFTIESVGPWGQGVVRYEGHRMIVDEPDKLVRISRDCGPNYGSNMLVLEYQDRTVLTLSIPLSRRDIDLAIEDLARGSSGNAKQRRRQRREAQRQIAWLESLR